MSNPFDPNNPLYQGQALLPQSPASGFHFLEGVGNIVTAIGLFASGGGGDDDEAEEQPPRRPRSFRSRVFGASPSARVGKGSCCRRPVGK
jgi:hypothetical protein